MEQNSIDLNTCSIANLPPSAPGTPMKPKIQLDPISKVPPKFKKEQTINKNHQEQKPNENQQIGQQIDIRDQEINREIEKFFDELIRTEDSKNQKIMASPKILEARRGLDQLGLNYISTKEDDVSELSCILALILNYPSTNQAVSHARANVLGTYDLITPQEFNYIQKGIYQHSDKQDAQEKKHGKKLKKIFDQYIDFDEKLKIFEKNEPPKPKNCPCCGLPQQKKKVKVWQDLHLVSHVGIAVNLFFMSIKNVIVLLTIMTLLLTSFSIASNMKSYQTFKETFNRDIFNSTDISNITDFANAEETANNFANNIMDSIPSDLTGNSVDQAIINGITSQVFNKYELTKLGNKILIYLQRSSLAGKYYLQGDPQNRDFARRTFFVECWLGACVIFIWIFVLAYLRFREKQYHVLIERLTTTASDFTLLFQNIPKYYAANDKINQKFEKVLQNYLRRLQSKTKVLEIYNIKKPKKKQENKEESKNTKHPNKHKKSDQKPQQSMVKEGQNIKQAQKHNNEQVVTENQINSNEKKQQQLKNQPKKQKSAQPPKQPSVPSKQLKQPSVPSQPPKQPIDIKINKVNFIFFFDKKQYYDPKNDFDDPQIKQYNRLIEDCRKQFVNTILKRKENHQFHISDKSRKSLLYDRWNSLQQQKKRRHQQIREQKLQEAYYDVKVEKKFQNLSAFVTFENTISKQIMNKLHHSQDSFWRKLSFYKDKKYIKFPHQTGFQEVKVTVAPEPEDIVWESYQKTDREAFLRKALTYTVVSIILGLSFLSVYKMTQLQLIKSQAAIRGQTISEADQNMSVYISLLLNFINTKLSFIIRYMSKFECNRTYTGQQRSMAIKTIMALCVNSIAIPLFMTILFNKSMYGQNGLADNVLFQTIINCLLNPIQKIVNPNYFMLKAKKVKGAQPQQKLNLTQEQLNSRYQEAQFQVGFEYSNLIFMYLFACFYATLQPAVVGITAAGLIFYYWSQKTYFLRFTKRPRKGTKEVNDYMFYIICLGPLCYTAGSVFWSGDIYGPEIKIPNLICFVLSLVVFLFPYTSVANYIMELKMKQAENFFSFEQQRIFIATEYDRLNPFSKKQAQKEFIQYQIKFIKDLNKKYALKQQFESLKKTNQLLKKLKQNEQKKAKKIQIQKLSKQQKELINKLKVERGLKVPDMQVIKELSQEQQKQEQEYQKQYKQEQQVQEYVEQQNQQYIINSEKWKKKILSLYERKYGKKIHIQLLQPEKKKIQDKKKEIYPAKKEIQCKKKEITVQELQKQNEEIIKKNKNKYRETIKYINYVKRKMKYFNFFGISDQNDEYDDDQQQNQQQPYIKVTVDANSLKQEAPLFTVFHTLYTLWSNMKKKKKEIIDKVNKENDKNQDKYKDKVNVKVHNQQNSQDECYQEEQWEEQQEESKDVEYSKIGLRLFLGDFESKIEIIKPTPKLYDLEQKYDFSKFEEFKYETDELVKKKKRKLIKKQQEEDEKIQKQMNKQLNNDDKQEDSKQNINLRRASALSSGSSVSSVGSLRKSSHFGLHKI